MAACGGVSWQHPKICSGWAVRTPGEPRSVTGCLVVRVGRELGSLTLPIPADGLLSYTAPVGQTMHVPEAVHLNDSTYDGFTVGG